MLPDVSGKAKLLARISETSLFILALMVWTSRILMTYVRTILYRLPVIGFMAPGIIVAAYLIMILLALPAMSKKLKAADVFFGLAVLAVCLLNFWLFPDNTVALEEHLNIFILYTFPLYYIGLTMDFDKIYPWLYWLSLITIFAYTGYKLFLSAPMDEIQSLYQGDMWGAYNLLPHVCVVALQMFKKMNILNVAATATGFLMLLSLGSRGPNICLILAMVLYLMFFKEYKKKLIVRALIILVGIAVIAFLDPIMRFLYDLMGDMGLSVRVFEKYFEGSFTVSDTRDALKDKLYELIYENPGIGYGIYSDYTAVGVYAHSIIVELWMSFGVFIGSGIFAGIVAVFIKALKRVKEYKNYVMLLLPLFVAGFVKLFLSSSIMEEIYFFLLLGVCVNLIRKSNSVSGEKQNENIE